MDRKVDKRRGKVHRTTISQQPLFTVQEVAQRIGHYAGIYAGIY